MVEAMACGTPVVALRRGAVPEIIVPGRTGIIVDHPRELAGAITRARALDPAACREHVETGFTVQAMAAGYETIYRQALTETIPLPQDVPEKRDGDAERQAVD